MCPFCISTVLSVAAGTVSVGGVAALFTFARRLGPPAEQPAPTEPEDA